ncbi:hypothetical protein [Pseudoxanthomonas winnipegensis]|uniref:Uncharacterized protein n=1 Tax=Pseudoxanthomonas winnipegensis TaxID=2480810 RepID=A0A4Q8LEX7_9GAMM|nr:hypothetical protein [Pseudoxanthomonas winnipegensis]RZZ81049.1 hypothetical protein EA662_18835 [Pseudoxanthomonas winnipegensis]TAA27731.1 hypothetical protein EA661_13385 [Pseudoxanthomonas winnipegensis]TAA42067.1 hypothetical protein EAT51_07245 [Pseudoxanthomonas winnipegensis]TBV69588.1 hypothetical protein EYC46_19105 [Pseudoxanthomonas winnipegensis]
MGSIPDDPTGRASGLLFFVMLETGKECFASLRRETGKCAGGLRLAHRASRDRWIHRSPKNSVFSANAGMQRLRGFRAKVAGFPLSR